MNAVREWLQTIVPGLNLFLILFGLIKIFNRHEREWRDKEDRLLLLEKEMAEWRGASAKLAAIGTKLDDLNSEMQRIRDRVDRFLDTNIVSVKTK